MIRSISIALAAVALSACVSVLPEQETPEGLYRFGPMTARHSVDATVAIREPDASRLFGGRAIASEDASGAIRLVRGVEWADRATRLMQISILASLDDAGEGVAVAFESGVLADYELVWSVEDFMLTGTEAHCGLEATLIDARARTVVAQTNVTTSASASGSTNAARALALAEAGRACVGEVSAFVAEKAVQSEEPSEQPSDS